MISIAEFGRHTGHVIHGEFSLVAIEACRTLPKERIILEDSSGTASLLFAGNRSFNLDALKATSMIKAELIPQPMNTGMGGTLLSAKPVGPALITNAAAVVPSSEVPLKAQQALRQLVTLIDEITVPELKACMNGIIQKHLPTIATAKAGWSYHHSYPGGLLVHTVSVMARVNSIGSTTFIGDRPRVELMILAALIHDLGKAVQIQNYPTNPAFKHLRHELLNLPLCIEELAALGNTWPNGAKHLSRLLNWLCSGTEERRRNHCIDAEFVHMMDIIDVWQDRAQAKDFMNNQN